MNTETITQRTYPVRELMFALVLSLITMLGVAYAQETQIAEENPAVIEVGETSITLEEFNERFGLAARSLANRQGLPYNEETRALFDELRPAYLEQLATEQVLLQEAETRGISVTDEELDARLEEIRANYESDEAFNQFLSETGFEDEAEFREFVREQETIQRTIEQLGQEVEVSDEDIQSYYDENQEQIGQPLDQVRDQVRAQVERERLNERFAELREAAGVNVYPEAVAVETPEEGQ